MKVSGGEEREAARGHEGEEGRWGHEDWDDVGHEGEDDVGHEDEDAERVDSSSEDRLRSLPLSSLTDPVSSGGGWSFAAAHEYCPSTMVSVWPTLSGKRSPTSSSHTPPPPPSVDARANACPVLSPEIVASTMRSATTTTGRLPLPPPSPASASPMGFLLLTLRQTPLTILPSMSSGSSMSRSRPPPWRSRSRSASTRCVWRSTSSSVHIGGAGGSGIPSMSYPGVPARRRRIICAREAMPRGVVERRLRGASWGSGAKRTLRDCVLVLALRCSVRCSGMSGRDDASACGVPDDELAVDAVSSSVRYSGGRMMIPCVFIGFGLLDAGEEGLLDSTRLCRAIFYPV
ncbi:hypothetical protein B0H10DRAFT_2011862 [Mycena sp. CBHHK59/15]|nr:hypothetical protein B0H10DRAFT_2011862 [Mycena sp. CBHHK59/15]